MKNLVLVKNPVVQDALGNLRNAETTRTSFRRFSEIICSQLISNAIQQSDLVSQHISTPLTQTDIEKIKKDFVFIIILRSAIAMLYPALRILPDAVVGFAGIARDEKTAIAQEYYWKLPVITTNSIVIIPDPMIATGGSMLHVLRKLKHLKPKEIRIISIVAAPEGIEAIFKEFPDITITTTSVDKALNKQKYIVPGLGDFGDRFFGTE